jgi:hypothetical protein
VGIAICDLGGEALFDNLRMFKVADGADVVDPFQYPGDANEDGKIDNKDLGLLQQYLNEWDVELK